MKISIRNIPLQPPVLHNADVYEKKNAQAIKIINMIACEMDLIEARIL